VSTWPATKARLVLAALLRIGWTVKRSSGSHRVLAREGWPGLRASHGNCSGLESATKVAAENRRTR